ncbi:putative MFS family arabinose efflux permease [Halopolyspora algeriensis]|uniref:Putative MFS family arabinose efflux permease n=1 Tax=Halopolyspora algeriensis TaxID=1500506 RepID=A0A368VYH4_9ACTN|nr:MFS transporter [Halopolyspora algeriensis]RCW45287.1 putative MFS family arabinose efflux permease [Halopolyspora algeriensis]TQM47327.1 putative MFS family arabinose efflux permease [Halopolyspora algeriensis]
MRFRVESRPPEGGALRSRSFLMLLVATLGAFAGYVTLLPVVPLWAVEAGASEVAAGATTGLFMLVTVLTQLGMPWLLQRVDHRIALGLGTFLIGVPTPLFALATELWALLAVSGVRGVGFGLLTVTGSALVAELVPPSQRGRAAGLYGLAVGLPNAVLLPVGVWLAGHVGFVPLFWAAGALPVAATIAVAGIAPVRDHAVRDGAARTHADRDGTDHLETGRSRRFPAGLLPPWLVMTAVSIVAGGVIAFLPLATASAIASVALLAFGMAATVCRWLAGQLGDRFGSRTVLLPSVLLAGVGMVGVAVATGGQALVAVPGALVLGGGFGAVQNATLVLMFERAPAGPASTTWNIAYDAGNGIGATGFGVLVGAVDYPITSFLAAALVFCCVPFALLGEGTHAQSSYRKNP